MQRARTLSSMASPESMTDAAPRRRPSALVIVAFVLEVLLLVLFVPVMIYSELLQASPDPSGRANAVSITVLLLVVAIVLVIGSVVGYLRDRKTGVPIGFAVAAIALGVLLAIGHAGVMLPNALT